MRTVRRLFFIGGLLALGLIASSTGVGPKAPAGAGTVELIRNVEYGQGGERALKLHILRPKTPPKETMPALVWIHGGGWLAGNKDSGIPLLSRFANRGYFCASIEYRFSTEAVFPA